MHSFWLPIQLLPVSSQVCEGLRRVLMEAWSHDRGSGPCTCCHSCSRLVSSSSSSSSNPSFPCLSKVFLMEMLLMDVHEAVKQERLAVRCGFGVMRSLKFDANVCTVLLLVLSTVLLLSFARGRRALPTGCTGSAHVVLKPCAVCQ